jgi:transposase
LSEATKRRLLEYFVLGVPAYRLRFRSPVSLEATERFFRLCRRVLALAEECQQPFAGRIECDEAMFGGKRMGKRGWGAAGKVLVFGILQRNGRVACVQFGLSVGLTFANIRVPPPLHLGVLGICQG